MYSELVTDSLAPLLCHDARDIGLLILIQKTELTIDVALAVENDLSRSPLYIMGVSPTPTFEPVSINFEKHLLV